MTISMADRIRQARLDASLTQARLAESLGVNRSAVAQWERKVGGTQPSISHLIQIAEMTQVAFEWIATGRESARRKQRRNAPKPEAEYSRDTYEAACLQVLRRVPPRRRDLVAQLLRELSGSY